MKTGVTYYEEDQVSLFKVSRHSSGPETCEVCLSTRHTDKIERLILGKRLS